MKNIIKTGVMTLLAVAALASPAAAKDHDWDRGHGNNHYNNHYDRYDRHDRSPRFSINFSSGPRYPYYGHYYGRPVVVRHYYTPQPVVYTNYVITQQPAYVSADLSQGRYCREYQAIAIVGGRQQQTYGSACYQPDGSWEIVN